MYALLMATHFKRS